MIDEPEQETTAKAPVKPAIETQKKMAPAPARELTIFLDGKFVPESEAKVSVFDHGLLYGDGIFEGIRFYNGRVFRLEEHHRPALGFGPLDLPRDSNRPAAR